MKSLDFYEFAGIVCPGVIFLASCSLVFFGPKELMGMEVGFSLFAIVIAYVVGHLIQAFGNWFESLWWFLFRGMPTDWVQRKAEPIITEKQREKVINLVSEREGISYNEVLNMHRPRWFLAIRSLYGSIEGPERLFRIERFNGNYGLLRGVGVSFFLSAIVAYSYDGHILVSGGLFFSGVIAVYRMHRFSKYYARELFNQIVKTA